jgi:hypothetical protein
MTDFEECFRLVPSCLAATATRTDGVTFTRARNTLVIGSLFDDPFDVTADVAAPSNPAVRIRLESVVLQFPNPAMGA